MNDEFELRIIFGRRRIRVVTGEVEVAIAKIQAVLQNWINKDQPQTAELVKFIEALIDFNDKGLLSPDKVVQLHQKAEKLKREDLLECTRLLKIEYRMANGIIDMRYRRSSDNRWEILPLSFNMIDIDNSNQDVQTLIQILND